MLLYFTMEWYLEFLNSMKIPLFILPFLLALPGEANLFGKKKQSKYTSNLNICWAD